MPGSRELRDVVGEQAAQVVAHAVAAQVDDAHVRDVEHAGVATHGVVLLDLRAVVDRHVPAAEVDGAGPGRHVQCRREECANPCCSRPLPCSEPKKRAAGRIDDLPPLCPFDLRDREPAAGRYLSPSVGRATAHGPLSRAHQVAAVLLPERFRAGCAFGGPLSDLSPDKPCDGCADVTPPARPGTTLAVAATTGLPTNPACAEHPRWPSARLAQEFARA